MKFWHKIYLFSVLLFSVSISFAGLMLVRNLHNSMLGKEIEKSIAEEKVLAHELEMEALYSSWYLPEEIEKASSRSLNQIIEDYIDATPVEGYYQVLDMDDNILYTDFNFPKSMEHQELEKLTPERVHYILREFENKKYVYICGLTNISNGEAKVYYAKDLTSIYETTHKQYGYFIRLDIFICIVFSIFMIFISQFVTKPIENLVNSTNKIATGNYSERAKVYSKDEFSVLAKQFNHMAHTIEEKIGELETSNSQKEAFINNFTHELKTPLTSIIGYADFLRTSRYDEKLFFEASDYIYKEGKNLEKIAFKMMDLIYSKTQPLNLETIEVVKFYYDIKKSFYQRLQNKGIELIIRSEAIQIVADPILLKMLFNNFIDNAIKASHEGGKIYLETENSQNGIVLSVEDEGIGISKEHLDKIRQPFYIVDASRTKKNNGVGLGLAICQKIVEAHGAKLQIESEIQKGTKVSVIFRKNR